MTNDEAIRCQAAQVDLEAAVKRREWVDYVQEHGRRPSTLYSPELSYNMGHPEPFTAVKGQLLVRGRTPQEAYRKFDQLWLTGKSDAEEPAGGEDVRGPEDAGGPGVLDHSSTT